MKRYKFLIREVKELDISDLELSDDEFEKLMKDKSRKAKKELEIIKLLKENFSIEGKYIINEDFTVSVNGDVKLINKEIEQLPITFKEVTGMFECSYCNLISLDGAPKEVKKFFCVKNKNLTSLAGGPEICEDYYCNNCNLQSLQGAPKEVKYFVCRYNKNLTSLVGGPEICEVYDCHDCNIQSLEGVPKHYKKFIYFNNPIYKKYGYKFEKGNLS